MKLRKIILFLILTLLIIGCTQQIEETSKEKESTMEQGPVPEEASDMAVAESREEPKPEKCNYIGDSLLGYTKRAEPSVEHRIQAKEIIEYNKGDSRITLFFSTVERINADEFVEKQYNAHKRTSWSEEIVRDYTGVFGRKSFLAVQGPYESIKRWGTFFISCGRQEYVSIQFESKYLKDAEAFAAELLSLDSYESQNIEGLEEARAIPEPQEEEMDEQQPLLEESQLKIASSIEGVGLEISPLQGKLVKDVVTVSIIGKVPAETKAVQFILDGEGSAEVEEARLGVDKDGSDGWSISFDTRDYGDGSYDLFVRALDKEIISEARQLAAAEATGLTIENQLPKAKIVVHRYDTKVVVQPTQENIIKGSVMINMPIAPEKTETIGVAVFDQTATGQVKYLVDNNKDDGWSIQIDTRNYPNNNYGLIVMPFDQVYTQNELEGKQGIETIWFSITIQN